MNKLLAPNGKKSNLTPEQYKLVRTKAFKDWFGDWENDPQNASKVVDENGEPLVVYHGSDNMDIIKVFKSSKGFDYNFFSSEKYESYRYVADFERAFPEQRYDQLLRKSYYDKKVKMFFLNSRKIFDYNKITIKEKNKVFDFLKTNEQNLIDTIIQFAQNTGMSFSVYLEENDITFSSNIDLLIYFLEISSDDWWILETKYFQGFIKENGYDAFVTKESGNFNIAIYNPLNIKLADGTNTTFDSSSPDIRYSKGGKIESLIQQGVVDLKMYDTKPEHAETYGFESSNPLFVQKISFVGIEQNKKAQENLLEYIDEYAKANNHDLIFGHIAEKAEPNVKVIKDMLQKADYTTIEGNNDFYKYIEMKEKFDKGGRTVAQTPAPAKDRIYGSKVNKKGSASSESKASSIKLSESIISVLEDKMQEHNSEYPNKKVSLAVLKAVFRRGAGAYSSSHRPTISGGKPNSRTAWAYARVNRFLEKKAGKQVKKAYVQDDDLIGKYAKGGEVGSSTKFMKWWLEWYKPITDKMSIYISFPIDSTQFAESNVVILDLFEKIDQEIDAKPYLNDIVKKADEYGTTIYLNPTPRYKQFSKNSSKGRKVTKSYLIEYYKRFGFKLTDGDFMKRLPSKKYHLGGDMSKHLAPNGKPSNLTHEQWHLVRTPEFKAWFGDWENDPENASKVVDENGEPLVVYHFSDLDFNVFEIKGISKGFFFTENKKDDEFSKISILELLNKGEYPNWIKKLMEQGISIEKIIENVNESKYEKVKSYFLNLKKMYPLSWIGEVSDKNWSVPYFENLYIDKARERGFNGIEFIRESDKKRIIVAFEPNQIKLADGTNTTFDANSPDIRFADGGMIKKKAYVSIRLPFDIEQTKVLEYKYTYNDLPFKELASGTLDGVLGVSSSRNNIAEWFVSRDCLIVMDYEQFEAINNTEVIEYDNPTQLLRDKAKLFRRLYNNLGKSGELDKYIIKQTYTKIGEKIVPEINLEMKLADGQKYSELYRISQFLNPSITSSFYQYVVENDLPINSPEDFTNAILTFNKMDNSYLGRGYENQMLTFDELLPIVSKGITYASKIYESEQEVIMLDKKLNIPENSQLFFIKKQNESNLTQLIDEYNLSDKYRINFVEQKDLERFRTKFNEKEQVRFEEKKSSGIAKLEIKKNEVLANLLDYFINFSLNSVYDILNKKYGDDTFNDRNSDDYEEYKWVHIPIVVEILSEYKSIVTKCWNDVFSGKDIKGVNLYSFMAFEDDAKRRLTQYFEQNRERFDSFSYRGNSGYFYATDLEYPMFQSVNDYQNSPEWIDYKELATMYLKQMGSDIYRYFTEDEISLKSKYEQGGNTSDLEFDLMNVDYKINNPTANTIVFVDPKKILDYHYSNDPDFAIIEQKNQIGNRVSKAEKFLTDYVYDNRRIDAKTGERTKYLVDFEPSIVGFSNNKLTFTDGRHRILSAYNLGAKAVAIEVPKDQKNKFIEMFSTSNSFAKGGKVKKADFLTGDFWKTRVPFMKDFKAFATEKYRFNSVQMQIPDPVRFKTKRLMDNEIIVIELNYFVDFFATEYQVNDNVFYTFSVKPSIWLIDVQFENGEKVDNLFQTVLRYAIKQLEENTFRSLEIMKKEGVSLSDIEIDTAVSFVNEKFFALEAMIENLGGMVTFEKGGKILYHGSPYNFDKFSLSQIGTGEGAQAFGWGLYFTDLEDIARNYAVDLARYDILIDGRPHYESSLWNLATILAYNPKGWFNMSKEEIENEIKNDTSIDKITKQEVLSDIKKSKSIKVEASRNLYKVSLHKDKAPDEFTWLEWDKPIGDKIAKKINDVLEKNDIPIDVYSDDTGQETYRHLANWTNGDNGYSEKSASLFLLKNGIDGIKYPAESLARGTTSDTARGFNYVVFDDDFVNIEDKKQFKKGGSLLDTKIEKTPLKGKTLSDVYDLPELYELAEKYKMGLDTIRKEYLKGIEVEREHTNDYGLSAQIALNHLNEDSKYYTKLKKAKLQRGGKVLKITKFTPITFNN